MGSGEGGRRFPGGEGELLGRCCRVRHSLTRLLLQRIEKVDSEMQAARAKAEVRQTSLKPSSPSESSPSRAWQASPVHSLPPELLILALTFALDAHDTPLPPPSTTLEAPLRINPIIAASAVCRGWHSTITSATSLWKVLRIDGQRCRTKAPKKAEFWAGRALGRGKGRQEGGRRGAGITSLTLTNLENITHGDLRVILSALDPADGRGPPPALTSFAASWSSSARQDAQVTSVIRHLVSTSATTLTSLTLHMSFHVQIHLSLPRLCNTFVALSTLSLRSASTGEVSRGEASTVQILPHLLPPYDGEDDWPPTALRRLTLVGPTWRLRFRDGTIASPELTREDCPKLEELELGRTRPSMTWDLLSAKGLARLSISDTSDSPTEPDPDLTASSSTLISLGLSRSSTLIQRLFSSPSILANGIAFPHLTSLDLRGVHLATCGALDYISSASAPHLIFLSLAETTNWSLESLKLPLMAKLQVLDCSRAVWVDAVRTELDVTLSSTPRLQRLNLSNTGVRGSGVLKFVEARNPLPPATREDDEDPGIIELNMVGCWMMEEKAIKWLEGRIGGGGPRWTREVVGTPSEERKRWRGIGEW